MPEFEGIVTVLGTAYTLSFILGSRYIAADGFPLRLARVIVDHDAKRIEVTIPAGTATMPVGAACELAYLSARAVSVAADRREGERWTMVPVMGKINATGTDAAAPPDAR